MSPSPQDANTGRPLLQQAPVTPLDASGFTASWVGTILFGLLWVFFLVTEIRPEWVPILATGTGIGVILVIFTAGHRYRRSRQQRPGLSVED